MQTRSRFVIVLCITVVLSMLACEDADIFTPTPEGTARPEYTGQFEVKSTLSQTASHGMLSYDLKNTIPFTITWSAENSKWKLIGENKKATGMVTISGGVINCTGNMSGTVEIVGYVYPEKLKPCLIKLSIFQDWNDSTLVCKSVVPPSTYEIPNGSAAFTISDDFNFQATAGEKSLNVSYTSGALTGFLRLKMKSFSGTLIDGCGVTY